MTAFVVESYSTYLLVTAVELAGKNQLAFIGYEFFIMLHYCLVNQFGCSIDRPYCFDSYMVLDESDSFQVMELIHFVINLTASAVEQ